MAVTIGQKPKGSGYTNIQKMLQANVGNRLGQTVGGGVANTAGQARQAFGQATDTFRQKSEEARLDKDVNRQKIQSILADPTKSIGIVGAKDPRTQEQEQNLQQFTRFREGVYGGPKELENAAELRGRAQEVESLGRAVGSQGGRLGLLQRYAARPSQQYTGGQQRLDLLYLGQSEPELRQARQAAAGFGQEAARTEKTAREIGSQYEQRAKQFGQETMQALGTAKTEADLPIQQRLLAAQTVERDRQQTLADLRGLLSGQGLSAIKDAQGNVIREAQSVGSRGEGTQRALELMVNKGLIKPEDLPQMQSLAYRMTLPVYYRREGNTSQAVNFDKTLGDLIQENLISQEAQNITRGSLANQSERERLNALAQLGGGPLEFGQEAIPSYQAGKLAFDPYGTLKAFTREEYQIRGKTPEQYQADQAKLLAQSGYKGLSIEDLIASQGDVYKGLAQSQDEAARQDAINRIIAQQKYGPLSESARGSLDFIGKSINAPKQGTSYIQPKGEPKEEPGFLSKAWNTAKTVAGYTPVGLLAKGVGALFCYAEGTQIKRKDGSFVDISDLNVGDELFLGGKVKLKQIVDSEVFYVYKDVVMTGDKLIFKDGAFIRVKDLPDAKAYRNDIDIKVVAFECEHGLVVTEKFIGTDAAYSRMDLIEVNQNKEILRLIDLYDKSLFKGSI